MINLRTFLRSLLFVAAASFLIACGGESPAGNTEAPQTEVSSMATIEGTVLYRERMILPPDAQLEVQLEDISKADATATVLATVIIPANGAPPYNFAIEYDPASIDARMRYALRATIIADERMMFANAEYIDPFAGSPLEIIVQRVAEEVERTPAATGAPNEDQGAQSQPQSEAESDQSGPTWVLESLAGEPAPTGVDGDAANLQMDDKAMRASGFSGCNRYMGDFNNEGSSVHGRPLKFGSLASTMRACHEGSELETQFLQMLDKVNAYRIEDGKLLLLSQGEVLATFGMQ